MKWVEVLKYDENSPTGLIWIASDCDKIINGVTPAGAFRYSKKGKPSKITVSYGYKDYAAHRIIWEMFNGPIPKKMVIDHINGDPFDNRLCNLRCKTQKHNSQNSGMRGNNNTGVTGVHWHVSKSKNSSRTYACGRVTIEGKIVLKTFSVNRFGIMKAFKLAVEWRNEQIKLLNSKGNQYTERHGN